MGLPPRDAVGAAASPRNDSPGERRRCARAYTTAQPVFTTDTPADALPSLTAPDCPVPIVRFAPEEMAGGWVGPGGLVNEVLHTLPAQPKCTHLLVWWHVS